MKRKIRYFKHIYIVIATFLINAFIAFKMSFAMMKVINAAVATDWTLFWHESVLMIMFVLLLFPSNVLTAYCRSAFTKSVLTRMKTDYVESVFGKNINEFQKDNNATYVSALTNDFSIIEADYVAQVLVIAEGIINFMTGIIIYMLISPLILFVGIGIMVVNTILSLIVERPVKKHNKERSVLFAEYSSFIKEVLSAFSIIKNNGLEGRVRENFVKKSETVQQKKYVIDKILTFIFASQNVIINIVAFGLLLFAANMAIRGVVTFAGVVVIANNLDRLIGSVMEVSEAIPKLRSVKGIFSRIADSLKSVTNHVETLPFDHFQQGISFQNVSFAYGENTVLKNVDLDFEKGKKYLVIGPSGGGKSTVLRLLRKYFDPQEGNILIDGMPLKDVKKKDYFTHIANIEQMIFLFEDTLRNNLTLFKDYTPEEIDAAVAKAGLTEFVKAHPEGLDYMIYDNGKNVSGGEKSRIAIARGLLNKADIILLDEAFASLDYERAKEIEQSLTRLEGVTVINVSHVIIEENKPLYDHVVVVKNKSVTIAA
ncbi:MAG: ABC transporter ATP-binding protein [bacterium]